MPFGCIGLQSKSDFHASSDKIFWKTSSVMPKFVNDEQRVTLVTNVDDLKKYPKYSGIYML